MNATQFGAKTAVVRSAFHTAVRTTPISGLMLAKNQRIAAPSRRPRGLPYFSVSYPYHERCGLAVNPREVTMAEEAALDVAAEPAAEEEGPG